MSNIRKPFVKFFNNINNNYKTIECKKSIKFYTHSKWVVLCTCFYHYLF